MFATLDDLGGQVEMLIFNSAYAAAESKASVDRRVIVRGRVDHKDRGDTKLIVQEIEEFDPSPDEIASARPLTAAPNKAGFRLGAKTGSSEGALSTELLVLKVDARSCADSLIGDLKSVLEHFPGDSEVLLEMQTSSGMRRLRFGDGCRVSVSHSLRAELNDLLGPDALVA